MKILTQSQKYIQKRNSIIKFKLSLINVLITKSFDNLTEILEDTEFLIGIGITNNSK